VQFYSHEVLGCFVQFRFTKIKKIEQEVCVMQNKSRISTIILLGITIFFSVPASAAIKELNKKQINKMNREICISHILYDRQICEYVARQVAKPDAKGIHAHIKAKSACRKVLKKRQRVWEGVACR
jgi:hypothetical protein